MPLNEAFLLYDGSMKFIRRIVMLRLRADGRSKLVMTKITRNGELVEELRRSAGSEMLGACSSLAVDYTQSDTDSDERIARVVCLSFILLHYCVF